MIFIDTHVHFHQCFHPVSFFNHVEKNIQRLLESPTQYQEISCCLFLTESTHANYFETIRNNGLSFLGNGPNPEDRWIIDRTSEPFSIIVSNESGFRIYLIAGQQLQTAEGLEVLAVAPRYKIIEKKPVKIMISEVANADALAIVPWGFGKWIGKRGKVLREILQGSNPDGFFLGDNSGRPRFLPDPYFFGLARQKTIQILPGSDPLPFPSEVNKAGSFGLSLNGEISSKQPAEDIKRKLRSPELAFDTFGQLESIGRFIKHQLLMQLLKHSSKRFK